MIIHSRAAYNPQPATVVAVDGKSEDETMSRRFRALRMVIVLLSSVGLCVRV